MDRDRSEPLEIDTLRARIVRLGEVSRRVADGLTLDAVLQEVVDAVRSLSGASHGAVGVFDDSGQVRDLITSGASLKEESTARDLPTEQAILDCLKEVHQPIRLADLAQRPWPGHLPENHLPKGAFLGTPIRHLGKAMGGIYVIGKEDGRDFSEDDEETLAMLAAQAAIAIGYDRERRARVEMETERRRLEALLESSPVGVMLVDAATRTFALVNKEAQRILGMSPEPGSTLVQYQDVTINRRMDGKEYERHERPIRRALDHGEVVRAEEVLFELPDGRTVTTLFNATPIYSDDGEIVSAVGVLQDMTPLEEIERLRNEFLAMVSHEIRGPLTTIKGCTSIVLGSSEPPDISEVLRYFRMIDQQSDHLRGLVNNLLDMTRIEAGALSVDLKPTDVRSVVDDAKTAFLRRGSRNAIEVDLDPDLPFIAADGRRITQVLDNLLTNASKYSSDSSTIRVTGSRDGFFVSISVTDEGRGIPADQLARLFKKYSRIDDDRNERKIAGEGLGLAICKGIVEAHGGRIEAESAGEGLGTRISFTVPHAIDAANKIAGDASYVAPVGRSRILAVDDEPQALWLLRNILSANGHKFFGASNAEEVMSLLDTEQPHLVLLDMMLPDANGFELMSRVREVSDAPIIFLSGNDQEQNVVRALNMGAEDYIVKPFSSTELLARVSLSLRRRRSAGAAISRRRYQTGDLTINYEERIVKMSGCPVRLSPTEYKLLAELSISAGRTLTHDQIMSRVWGSEFSGERDLLRATVKNLRHKLGDDASSPRYIFTEPRVGYRMENS